MEKQQEQRPVLRGLMSTDMEQVLQLERQQKDPWGPMAYLKYRVMVNRNALVADLNGEIQGAVIFEVREDRAIGEHVVAINDAVRKALHERMKSKRGCVEMLSQYEDEQVLFLESIGYVRQEVFRDVFTDDVLFEMVFEKEKRC
jgi:hypothetical protein